MGKRSLPKTLIHRNGQLAPITDSTYTWDPARNLGSVDDAVDNTFDRTLGYDDIDRLVQADAPSGWGTTAIAYDGRGNITSQNFGPAGSLTYTYDAASNRLTGVSGNRNLTLSYDVYGNVIGNGEANFTYDDGSRLRCYRCGTPDQIDYDVDGKGMRVRASKASGLTYSFYAKDGRLLFEYSAADGYFDYVYLLDKLIAKRWATGTIHYHNDLLGSPIAATDGGGNLMWKENYRAWGRPTLITGQSTSSLWYTGAPYDHGTKLSYLGARWYDVVLGRFMGVDPAPFDETNLHSLNRYAYGNNNPFKFKDPDGQAAFLLFAIPILKGAAAWGTAGFAFGWSADVISQSAAFGSDVSYGGAVREAAPTAAAFALGGAVSEAAVIAWTMRQASQLANAGAGRSFGDIISDPKIFNRWLKHSHPTDKPLSASDAQKVWDKLLETGRKPRLDSGHVGTKWDMPHINVEGSHIPVEAGFKPPVP